MTLREPSNISRLKRPARPKPEIATTSRKAATGIEGFDEITGGGLPRGRTTLVEGTAGSGKTIMALQWLVNGVQVDNEPGIFVAFEESSERIAENAAAFGWNLKALPKNSIFFLEMLPAPDLLQSGGFDLSGLLAALDAKVREIGARRIVFDALDVILVLLNDPEAERRELYRLNEWLLNHGLTALITAKAELADRRAANWQRLSFMQFMVDCAVVLNHEVIQGVSQRNVRVLKYRGSAFSENESPFLISERGLEVAGARALGRPETPQMTVSTERVSSGVARLDAMLDGGYYRGAAILLTGFPGTAKSTLSGAFCEAACVRGEHTVFISFDSDAGEVVRNLASVNIRLERFITNGLLRLVSARAIAGSAEVHLMNIKHLAKENDARCVVIDPVSALSKAGNEDTAYSVAERLIDWSKAVGITLLCTSLLHDVGTQEASTPLQISTIADTWIHLNYLVQAGERNRGLSIVKSRGTAHSSQVRELVLSSEGVTLADAYTAGGDVLMGTLRWEKELAVRALRDEARMAAEEKQGEFESEEALLQVRLKALQLELKMKRAQKRASMQGAVDIKAELAHRRSHLGELRGGDKG